MAAMNIGERIENLIIVLVQELRKPITVSQVLKSADHDVGQSRRSCVIRLINPRNAELRRKILSYEERSRLHDVARVTDLELVDLVRREGMHIAQSHHQSFI